MNGPIAEPDDEPMKVRLDFDDMVEKMTKDPENKACSCAEGYLPIYHPESGYLMRCHDPIIKTATLGTNYDLLCFFNLFSRSLLPCGAGETRWYKKSWKIFLEPMF